MATLSYLCDLLVSRLLILDSWLNSTRSPVFILQPFPHFGRRRTVKSCGTGWLIPSVSTALLLTRYYSRGGGWWWCRYSCYWHSLRLWFIWYFRSHANRLSSLGLWLVTTDKPYHCKKSVIQDRQKEHVLQFYIAMNKIYHIFLSERQGYFFVFLKL
jgi:hypothetical protein